MKPLIIFRKKLRFVRQLVALSQNSPGFRAGVQRALKEFLRAQTTRPSLFTNSAWFGRLGPLTAFSQPRCHSTF